MIYSLCLRKHYLYTLIFHTLYYALIKILIVVFFSGLIEVLPDALKTQCSKCSPKQKNAAFKVVDRLQKDYPAEWKLLLDKWDPKREYSQKFEEFLQAEKKKGNVTF